MFDTSEFHDRMVDGGGGGEGAGGGWNRFCFCISLGPSAAAARTVSTFREDFLRWPCEWNHQEMKLRNRRCITVYINTKWNESVLLLYRFSWLSCSVMHHQSLCGGWLSKWVSDLHWLQSVLNCASKVSSRKSTPLFNIVLVLVMPAIDHSLMF